MLVVGSGGLAMQLIDDLEDQFKSDLIFWSDNLPHKNLIQSKFKVLTCEEQVKKIFSQDKRFIIAVGNPLNREKLLKKFSDYGGKCQSFISKKASISKYATIGTGSVVMQNVIIESEALIGECCLINIGTTITHECSIGDFTELAPAVVLAGAVKVEHRTFIGSGATVLPKINIGSNVIVGAMSLVTKDVPDDMKVYGVPAKPACK